MSRSRRAELYLKDGGRYAHGKLPKCQDLHITQNTLPYLILLYSIGFTLVFLTVIFSMQKIQKILRRV